MFEQTRVRIATGSGLVARRPTALLFFKGDSAEFVNEFMSAPSGSELDIVTQLAEQAGSDVVGFAVIDWSQDIRVAVYGDVEITSNQAALPRMSARDAGTWIERSVRRVEGAVIIGCDAGDVHEATDLRDGVVQADGFELQCQPAALTTSVPIDDIPSVPPQPELISEQPSPLAAIIAPDPGIRGEASFDQDDSFPAMQTQELAGLVFGGDQQVDPNPPEDIAALPDGAMDQQLAHLADQPGAVTASSSAPVDKQVQARLCGACSAPNPEDEFACRSCGAPLIPDEKGLSLVDAPQWRLIFEDGQVELVDKVLVLGRKPVWEDSSEDVRLVSIDCNQTSSTHLEVRPSGWELQLMDLGSSNGSFMLTTGDGQLVQLDANTPYRVAPGSLVQIGTKRFRLEEITDS